MMRPVQGIAKFFAFVQVLTLGISAGLSEEPAAVEAGKAAISVPHPFCEGKLWGYLNDQGKVVVKPQFRTADDFFCGRAIVNGDGFGYIRPDGSWCAKLPDGATTARRFSEDRGWFEQDGKYGCMDLDGKILIEPLFDGVGDFSEGLAPVMKGKRTTDDEGEASITDRRWGYVDQQGKLAIPLQFEGAEEFSSGLACTHRPGSIDFEYIDHSGKVVLNASKLVKGPTQFMSSGTSFQEGRLALNVDGRGENVPYSIHVDQSGKLIGTQKDRRWVSSFSEGLASFGRRYRDKIGFVNLAGKVAIEPAFDAVGEFHEGFCRVRIKDEWKFIDKQGAIKFTAGGKLPWNDAEDFHGGLARVHRGGTLYEAMFHEPQTWDGGAWYYINLKGQEVALCQRDGEGYPHFGREHGPTPH
jgi:hypothetical protein